MASLRLGRWPLVLVVLLLFQPCRGQTGVHLEQRSPMYQRLRRLDEQFKQFQALTQARLDMLAQNQNQNQNSPRSLESRVQTLTDQYHNISLDLGLLKQNTAQEIKALREWSRKMEKKSKRTEGRLALLGRNLRESRRRHTQKQKVDLGQNLSNITLELQGQEGRLASLEAQREELLVGVKRLQASLKNQEPRMSRLEERVGEILQGNEGGYTRGSGRTRDPLTSNLTPQEDPELRKTGMSTRVLGRYRQSQPQDNIYSQTYPQAPAAQNRSQTNSNPQAQSRSNQPKHSKVHSLNKTPPQHNFEPQTQFQSYPDYKPQSNFQPHPELYPRNQHHSQPHIHSQTQPQSHPLQPQRNPRPQSLPQQSVPYSQYTQPQHHSQPYPHTYPNTDPQVQGTHFKPQPRSAPYHQPQSTPPQPNQPHMYPNLKSNIPPQPQSEMYQPQVNEWRGGEEEERDVGRESTEIQHLLRLPVRQKIPAQPVPRRNASICNVDSMLLFPSASAQNYVTFSQSFPNLPELSMCLWLRVETGILGTLLSYATDDNDNQLVLYGRNSSSSSSLYPSSSSSSFSPSSSSSRSASSAHLPSSSSTSQSHPSYSSPSFSSSSSSPSQYSSSSSSSLDFVVGDPVYRRLPTGSLLDGHWHHLCILWSSIQGRFWHYTNRRLTSSGSNFQKGWEVPGGGSVVLGQEQDTVGGGFDPAEGFAGRMAGFTVWDRVLSPREVKGVAEGRGLPRGVVLAMEDIDGVHGEVKQVACECLEHCV